MWIIFVNWLMIMEIDNDFYCIGDTKQLTPIYIDKKN